MRKSGLDSSVSGQGEEALCNPGGFLTSGEPTRFSVRTLLHGDSSL